MTSPESMEIWVRQSASGSFVQRQVSTYTSSGNQRQTGRDSRFRCVKDDTEVGNVRGDNGSSESDTVIDLGRDLSQTLGINLRCEGESCGGSALYTLVEQVAGL